MSRHPRDGIRDRWRDEHVIPHKEIGDACKLLLLVIATKMTNRGAVSVPRDRLAAMLDVDPRRITAGIGEAINHGLLMKAGGGYRGMTAQYVAVIPSGKVDGERPPLGRKVAGERPPSNVHLSEPKPGRKVDAEHPPNARASVSETRKRDDRQRNDCAEREHDDKQPRSDEEAPARSRLVAASPEPDEHDDREGREESVTEPRWKSPEHDGSRAEAATPDPDKPCGGNPRCRVCGLPRLYSPATIARGICASCIKDPVHSTDKAAGTR